MYVSNRECDGRFLRNMIDEVREALDCLVETLRLAVWYNSGLRFSPAETAELLLVPVNSVANLDERGIRRIRERLGRRGVSTDDSSVRAVVCALAAQPASGRLLQRIDNIVSGVAL